MGYCIYLRKSRLDIEAERADGEDTLTRHKNILLDYAKKNNIPISKIYKEVVSGESLDSRPEMIKLLENVENGEWEGVLVTAIDRLARGDSIDQGIILRTFKDSRTKIITPLKTYDPNDDSDEEFFEFNLFFSRREYKMIKRRMQKGRQQSAKEGKFLSSVPPYGYDKVKIKNGKGYTLEINESEARVVKMVYDMYIAGSGMTVIAGELDRMGIPPRNREYWSKSTINDMLKNPVYTGKIRWSYKEERKDRKTGKLHKSFRDEYILTEGLHAPLIDEETFNAAQETRKKNTRKTTKKDFKLQNPLAGVVHCRRCGALMTRLGENSHCKYSTLKCSNKYCENISAPISSVENLLIQNLKSWLDKAEINVENEHRIHKNNKISEIGIEKLKNELKTINEQIQKTFDLLEQGVYTIDTFTERNTVLNNRKNTAEAKLQALEQENNEKMNIIKIREVIIPQLRRIVESYFDIDDAETRNSILKSILNDVFYNKTERNVRGQAEKVNFELEIFPKMFSEFQD